MLGMAESATQTITIGAPPDHCFAVATDFPRYPEWAKDVKEAVVQETDEQGRATTVEFRASALGRSTHYTLGYDYSAAPDKLSWKLIRGDIMRAIVSGHAAFSSTANRAGAVIVSSASP